MIRIAVVEDDRKTSQMLQEYIRRYEQERGESIQITAFEDGEDIVENYRAEYDIILMDIEMQFMNGMDAARIIRQRDEAVAIIFITNMAQYAIHGYSVNALDYVLKPVSYFAFSQRLDKAAAKLKKKERHYLVVRVKGGTRRIAVDDLLYIESQGHLLTFHMKGEEVAAGGTMKEMEEKLEKFHFCRCNNGYLVNLEHVDGIRDGQVSIGTEFLPISRPRRKIFQETLAAYMNEVIL